MSALPLQKAMRAAIVSDAGVLALVPAAAIFDRHGRPERFPCVVLGEAQEQDAELTLERAHLRVFSTLHVWTKEAGLTGAKAIVGALRAALFNGVTLDTGRLMDLRFSSATRAASMPTAWPSGTRSFRRPSDARRQAR